MNLPTSKKEYVLPNIILLKLYIHNNDHVKGGLTFRLVQLWFSQRKRATMPANSLVVVPHWYLGGTVVVAGSPHLLHLLPAHQDVRTPNVGVLRSR